MSLIDIRRTCKYHISNSFLRNKNVILVKKLFFPLLLSFLLFCCFVKIAKKNCQVRKSRMGNDKRCILLKKILFFENQKKFMLELNFYVEMKSDSILFLKKYFQQKIVAILNFFYHLKKFFTSYFWLSTSNILKFSFVITKKVARVDWKDFSSISKAEVKITLKNLKVIQTEHDNRTMF